MLTKSEVKNQGTFSLYKDGHFYDQNWEHTIRFEGNRVALYLHCEVGGSIEHLKDLVSLEDLIDTIDYLGIT